MPRGSDVVVVAKPAVWPVTFGWVTLVLAGVVAVAAVYVVLVTSETLTRCNGVHPVTTVVDANRVNVNGWISEQQGFTAPYVDTVDMESAVAVPDATSPLDPPPLLLGNGAAPADFDAGDHVNLTRNGYGAATTAFGPSVLVPDVLPGG
ncbi:hypothetical protein ACIOEW_00205 [Streptomyces sp. NPDC087901]|uniref:hypothetical protein n=1 Tax=Streptomyces sp. NPDC087901 TaxID=3365818 RepID=UPI00382D0156